MHANLSNKTLGDFQIESLLGEGCMARVYKARQISLRRPVALKVLEEGIFTPGDNIKRFMREAEAMARLEHPHIVPVYAAGEEHPYYFFAMRLMYGGNLADTMKRGVRHAQAVEWACQIAQALSYAHKAKVIHRDLKPSNVLMQEEVAFLGDFGLARLKDVSTITQKGFPVGTPLYMSPEQTRGEQAGPPSDCFALGVILYQMLTGEHPFAEAPRKGETKIQQRTQLFDRIQTGKFKPLMEADPDSTPLLVNIIDRALARDPHNRYPDGAAMLRDLDEARRLVDTSERLVRVKDRHGLGSSERDSSNPAQDSGSEAHPPRAETNERLTDTQSLPAPQAGPAPLFCFGRYEVIREIGHGGQGVVYEAHDPVLDRSIALKVVQRGWAEEGSLRDRFWHEARIAARLNHPHIIPVFDFGVEQNCPYLTMPLISGSSLDRYQEDHAPVPVKFALQVVLQVAEALEFAHANGVIHLDVKPGNIMIQHIPKRLHDRPSGKATREPPPFVLLTDFTMAQFRDADAQRAANLGASASASVSQAQSIGAGTVGYSAPEVLDPEYGSPGPASDVYSLGVVLHEMLTGKRLFKSDHRSMTKVLVLQGKAPPPSQAVPTLPREVDAFCLRMLRTEPEKRISSAENVITHTIRLMQELRG